MASTGAEIASAYVTITTKMPGIQKDISKQLGAVDVEKSGRTMGSRISSGIGKTLKLGAATAGLAAGAALGASLVKGFGRLNAIETAQAKMRGIGYDSEVVAKAMDNALKSVQGTAFGLGDAASVASQLMAANIEPGQRLERILKTVANNASLAGSSFGEMGSIFSKAATQANGVQNDVIGQLADKGIPIYKELGKVMGVTAGEVFKLASQGKVDFETFAKAAEAAAGTAALEMGKTVTGSWSNFMASLGRIGAGLLGGVWTHIAPVLQATTNAMGPLEELATSFGEKIGKFLAPAVEWLISALNEGVDFSMFTPLGAIFEAITPVLPVLSDAIRQVAGVLGGVLAQVLPPLLPPLTDLLGIFSDLVVSVLPALSPTLKLIGDLLVSLLKPILPLVSLLVGALAPVAEALAPLILAIVEAVMPLIEIAVSILVPVLKVVIGVMSWLAGIMSGVLVWAIGFLTSAFEVIGAVVRVVFDAIGAVAVWLFENVLQPAFKLAQVWFAVLGGVISGIWQSVIKPVWDAFASVVKYLFNVVVKPVFDAIGTLISTVWNTAIKPVFNTIAGVIVGTLGPVFTWLKSNIIDPVWNGIKATISAVWTNGIKPVIDTLVRVIQSDPKKAFEAARDAIGTAWKGIQDLAKKPVKFVIETVINGLIGTVNKILPDGMKIPTVPLPKGFSDGGYTGNIAPSAVAGVVHGNEHVIRAASRAKIEARHPGLLDHMNRTGTVPGYKKGGFVHPLPGAVITEEYGGYPGHKGIDMALPAGSPIRAAASGLVNFSGWYGGGGWMAGIDHRNGFVTHYKHMMSPPPVKVGQPVTQGQVIGFEGSTGDSTGPHLHFETILNGNRLNPRNFMNFDGSDSGDGGFFNILGGLKDGLLGKLKDAFPGGGMFVDVAAGLASSAIDGSLDFVKSMLGFHNEHEPKLYDNGGWLQPGLSLVANKTGAPERILTDSQWDALAEGRSGSVRVFIGDREFEGWMDERAESAVDNSIKEQLRARRFAGV